MNTTMIDPKFTEKIARWLQGDHKSDEMIKQGAMLLLQLNNDRAMYQRIIRNPKYSLQHLEYKLRRFLQLRQDGRTIQDVIKLDNGLTPHLGAIIEKEPVPVEGDAELLPVPQPPEPDGGNDMYVRKGIRPDHDRLPDNIKALWPKNAERWKKIKEAFETCKGLTEPCDRYEYLKVLKETWYKYKEDMVRYDEYRLTADSMADGAAPSLTPEQEKELANADSYISKNLPQLKEDIAAAIQNGYSDEEAKKISARIARIQQRVDMLLKNGRTFTPERIEQLHACNIKLTSEDNEQGQESK